MAFDPAAIFVAVLIATGGLWWFTMILKTVRQLPNLTKYGVYALIWLAYFVLVLLIIRQSGG